MSAMPGRNPYRPGVGTRPPFLAGRDAEIRRFRAILRSAPEIPGNVRLTGLRGVGKTVLLAEFKRVAEEEEWAVAQLELEPRHNTDAALVGQFAAVLRVLRDRVSTMSRVKSTLGRTATAAVRSLRVGYQDIAFSIDPQLAGPAVELSRALHETVSFVVEKGRMGLAILLDEAQMLRDEAPRGGEHPLSMLIVAVSALQRAEIPIALVVCGLPTLTTNLLRARTYSERMFRGEHIGSLSQDGAKDAFVQPLADTLVEAEPRLVEAVLDSVEGYPYFIQLWGAELWDAADAVGIQSFTVRLLREIEDEIFRRLDTDFYEPRVQTLTPAEQDLLLSGAECSYPPLRVSDIQQTSDKTPGNVNVLLGRLVESGVIYRLRKGQYEYTAPKFHDFLRRRAARLD